MIIRGEYKMESRTLVKIKAESQYLLFRTISRGKKSPHAFYIPRSSPERLDGLSDPVVVVSNFPDFAEFRRNVARGELQIRFSWMNCTNDRLTGWTETVTLPYDVFIHFLRSAAEGEQWSVLSSEKSLSPRLIFCEGDAIREVASNKLVRRKLARFLRDHFQWKSGGTIHFFSDYVPYSFFFRETPDGQPGICGGLILHDQEDMKRAYYSVHT